MATVYDFLNPDSTEVEEQRIIRAPAATPGDVLTVAADGTVAPAPGGGSQNLEQVLAAGNDAGTHSITGLESLTLDSGDVDTGGGNIVTESGDVRTGGGAVSTAGVEVGGGGDVLTDGGAVNTGGGDILTDGGAIQTDGGDISLGAGALSSETFSTDNIPTGDEKAALDAANAPDANNAYATIADIGGGGVANPLVADLLAGGHVFRGAAVSGGTGASVNPADGGAGDFQGSLQLAGGDGAAGKIGGQASMTGGGGDAGAQSGAEFIAAAGTATDPGVAQVISRGVYFELRQAAFVANGSTVDQLRDSLIAAGLMAAS